MWGAAVRTEGLGLPSCLRGLADGGVRVRVVGAWVWLDASGQERRRVALPGDAATVAQLCAGAWTWTVDGDGASLRGEDGRAVARIPRPGLLGFGQGAGWIGVVGEAGAVGFDPGTGRRAAIPGRWAQVAGGRELVFAGPSGLAVGRHARRVLCTEPVHAVRVVDGWICAGVGHETWVFCDGVRAGVVPLVIAPGLPAAAHAGALWLATRTDGGLVELVDGRVRRRVLEGETVLSLAAGHGRLLAVVGSELGQGRVVEVGGDSVLPGPEVDPLIARVAWAGHRLVCGGVRELAMFEQHTG
ncbi:MAG: hypothetical protein ACI8PZ_002961 [Myxococcota bacterium]|jgi:hypothetical protein